MEINEMHDEKIPDVHVHAEMHLMETFIIAASNVGINNK